MIKPNPFTHNERFNKILRHFIDVLRVNIFIVDAEGWPLLMPRTDYGWKLLADSFSVGVLQNHGQPESFLKKYVQEGEYLRYEDPFQMSSFAIPLGFDENSKAYLILGPVILNRRLERMEYEKIAGDLDQNSEEITGIIDDVRVISFNNLKSTLDLLREVSQYVFEKENLQPAFEKDDVFSSRVKSLAQDVNSLIYVDDVLLPLLDITLAITQAECGSIMVLNEETNELTIKVSRGISEEKIQNTCIKVGEGIAGLAAEQKASFVIDDKVPDNRIKHLLKRPEIKHSIVLPLVSHQNNVLGVLSVSTQKKQSRLAADSEGILKSLSQLTSAAIQSMSK